MSDFSDRQKQIVLTSIQLIAEKGIQGLTIRNLSRRIGISEPAIYRHFDSKIDIILGILAYFRDGSLPVLKRILTSGSSSIEKLELVFLNHFERFRKEPALASVVFSEEIFQDDHRLSSEISSIMSENRMVVSKIIREGQQGKEIRQDISCEHLSMIIMGSLRLLIKNWRLSEFSFDLYETGSSLWNSLEKLLKGTCHEDNQC